MVSQLHLLVTPDSGIVLVMTKIRKDKLTSNCKYSGAAGRGVLGCMCALLNSKTPHHIVLCNQVHASFLTGSAVPFVWAGRHTIYIPVLGAAGGRVSDSYDRRVLTTYLEEYLGDFLFDEFQPFHFFVGKDGAAINVPPPGPREVYIKSIEGLPLVQSPEVSQPRATPEHPTYATH